MHKYLTTLQQHQANMSVISLAFVDSAKDKGMSASPAAFPCPLHKRKWHWNVCFPLDVDLYFFWNQQGMHDSSRWNNIWMPAKGACRCFRGADVGPSPCMALEPDSAAHRKNHTPFPSPTLELASSPTRRAPTKWRRQSCCAFSSGTCHFPKAWTALKLGHQSDARLLGLPWSGS